MCPSTTCQAENSDPIPVLARVSRVPSAVLFVMRETEAKNKRNQTRAIRLKAEVMVSEEWHMGLVRATSPGKTTQRTRQEPQAGRNWMGADSSAAHKHPFVF